MLRQRDETREELRGRLAQVPELRPVADHNGYAAFRRAKLNYGRRRVP
jgi:hypothetical protein